MSLSKIEKLSEKYSAAANAINARVAELNQEIEELTLAANKELKRMVSSCQKARDNLHQTITDHPELFIKPRTLVFSGIKVGFAKGKDTLEADEEKTCALITKKLPDQKGVLIKVTEKLVDSAIKNLDAKQLRSIGVKLIEGKDQVVLKPTDSAVNKAVSAHLNQD
ncbi:MAG: host-nuclease inhibitor Gam family protein [Porticoccus sp.]|nr:host-nuclease inhibitor Gam family protein [Porticoccus sp.]